MEAPRWFEDALAIAPAVSSVSVDGARISYRTWGTSRSSGDVLLVHGGAANARWWDHLAPLLASDRRVVAVDLSGHGDSDHRSEYSLATWADELAAVVRDAGLAPLPVVIGHSLGGFVTVELARRGMPGLGGAVIVDSPIGESPAPRSPEPTPARFGNSRVYPTSADAIQRFRAVPPQPMLPYVAAHIAESSVREVEGGWGWKFDPAFIRLGGGIPQSLRDLACRAVLIAGERGIVPAAVVEESRGLPGVAVVEVPDAGHAIMLDQPLALLAALRGILAGWATGEVLAG
jgi:pimeloyl-ACP methyl ester carboxylesterase